MNIPDLIHISQIRSYIVKLTGVLISKRMVRRLTRDGDIPIMILPSDRRKRFTRKTYILEFVRKHTKKKPEPTFEKVWRSLHNKVGENNGKNV